MKRITKILLLSFLASGLVNSCETTDLNIRVSPNDLAADQADPNLLLNSIQLAYAANMEEFNNQGSRLTRIDYFDNRSYFNELTGDTFDDIWERTYSSTDGNDDVFDADVDLGIYTNVERIRSVNLETEDIDYSFHIAVGETLKAHMLLLLVDYLGVAAYSEAGNPDEFEAPMLDDGATVYSEALALLDEAEAIFAAQPELFGANDFFYGGDSSKWIKLINTIRLKAAVTTGDMNSFDAIVAEGDFILENEDNFVWQYGNSELQPDNRHPDYQDDYKPDGADLYRSNWLMEQMLEDSDPRIRYYFYRQVDATPGADAPPSEEQLACSLAVPPPHYAGFTYCSVSDGYWGRSHGNNEGIPPDGFQRTAVGVFPAAGRFDDSSFGGVGLGLGGGGAGVEPIFLASYIDFWRAEMATAEAEKAEFLRSGLEKSIAYVRSFGSLDVDADLTTAPTAADVTGYIDAKVAEFLSATGDDQTNVLAEQYFATLYGGGAESYNYYRRTGFPTTLAPNWEANPGPFPRTFLLPQTEVVTNPNLSQRTDNTTQVFWDTNPPSPAFPPAN